LKASSYIDSYCAFLDILGFESFVDGSDAGFDKFSTISSAIWRIGDLVRVAGIFPPDAGLAATQFSDSFVVSTGATQSRQRLDWLIWSLTKLARDLSRSGVFFRGGICKGSLVHQQGALFGPAMIEAYKLEKRAIHPRVVLDEATHHELTRTSPSDEIGRFVNRVVRRDSDGQWFIDYINWQDLEQDDTVDAGDAWMYLRSLAHWISMGLKQPDLRVQDKYRWLARRYDESREAWIARGVSRYAREEDLTEMRNLPTGSQLETAV
jgi:hypothetical protein